VRVAVLCPNNVCSTLILAPALMAIDAQLLPEVVRRDDRKLRCLRFPGLVDLLALRIGGGIEGLCRRIEQPAKGD
jgi:hypothetical protein